MQGPSIRIQPLHLWRSRGDLARVRCSVRTHVRPHGAGLGRGRLVQRRKFLAKPLAARLRLGFHGPSLLQALVKLPIERLAARLGLLFALEKTVTLGLGRRATPAKLVRTRLRLIHDLLPARGDLGGAPRGILRGQLRTLRLQLQLQRALGRLDRLAKALARFGALLHPARLLLGDHAVPLQIALGGQGRFLQTQRLGVGVTRVGLERGALPLRGHAARTRLGLRCLGIPKRGLGLLGLGLRLQHRGALRLQTLRRRKHGLAIPSRASFGLKCRLPLTIDRGASLVLAHTLALERLERTLELAACHHRLVIGSTSRLEQRVATTHGLGGGLALPLDGLLHVLLVRHRTGGLLAGARRGGAFGLECLQRPLRMLTLRVSPTKRLVGERLLRLGACERLLGRQARRVRTLCGAFSRLLLGQRAIVRLACGRALALQSIHQGLHHAPLQRGLIARLLRLHPKALRSLLGLARDGVRALGPGHGFLGAGLGGGPTRLGLVGTRALLQHRLLGHLGGTSFTLAQRSESIRLVRRRGRGIPARLRGRGVTRKFRLRLERLLRQLVRLPAGLGRATRRLGRRLACLRSLRAACGRIVKAAAKFVHRVQRTLMLALGGRKLFLQSLHGSGVGLTQRLLALRALSQHAGLALASFARLRLHPGQRLDPRLRLLRFLTFARTLLRRLAPRLLDLALLTPTLAVRALLHESIAPCGKFLRETTHLRRVGATRGHRLRALKQQSIERRVHHVAPAAAIELHLQHRHTEALREGLQSTSRIVLMPTHDIHEIRGRVRRKPRACEQLANAQRGGVLERVEFTTTHEATSLPGLQMGLERRSGA